MPDAACVRCFQPLRRLFCGYEWICDPIANCINACCNDGGGSGWLLVCRQTVLKRADGTPDPSSWWSSTDEALLLSDPSKPQFCSDLLREPNPRLCDPDDGKPMVRYKMIGWDKPTWLSWHGRQICSAVWSKQLQLDKAPLAPSEGSASSKPRNMWCQVHSSRGLALCEVVGLQRSTGGDPGDPRDSVEKAWAASGGPAVIKRQHLLRCGTGPSGQRLLVAGQAAPQRL